MEIRAKMAEKFLKKGNKVKVEMRLRGREKRLSNFAKDKMQKFFEILKQRVPIKFESQLKKEPRGFTIIISKA